MLQILKYAVVSCLAVVSTSLYAAASTFTCPQSFTCTPAASGFSTCSTSITSGNPPAGGWANTSIDFATHLVQKLATFYGAWIEPPSGSMPSGVKCVYLLSGKKAPQGAAQVWLFPSIKGNTYSPAPESTAWTSAGGPGIYTCLTVGATGVKGLTAAGCSFQLGSS